MKQGAFITLEGIDGTGKSTQLRLLVRHLRSRGFRVTSTREPGGTRLGEQIRRLILARRGDISPFTELALMYATRAQHLEEVVRPALARGEVVVSDRFNDASLAYQGYGRRLGTAAVRALDKVVCGRTQPDLTLLLDLAPRLGLERARGRERRRNRTGGRFEALGLKFQERVRAGYLGIARREPRRMKLVRADRPVGEIHAEIRKLVEGFLAGIKEGVGNRQ